MNKIQDVLDQQGRSQTWLAQQLGDEVSRQTLNAYCNNHQQPRLDVLYSIASVLGVPVKTLIGDGSEIKE